MLANGDTAAETTDVWQEIKLAPDLSEGPLATSFDDLPAISSPSRSGCARYRLRPPGMTTNAANLSSPKGTSSSLDCLEEHTLPPLMQAISRSRASVPLSEVVQTGCKAGLIWPHPVAYPSPSGLSRMTMNIGMGSIGIWENWPLRIENIGTRRLPLDMLPVLKFCRVWHWVHRMRASNPTRMMPDAVPIPTPTHWTRALEQLVAEHEPCRGWKRWLITIGLWWAYMYRHATGIAQR